MLILMVFVQNGSEIMIIVSLWFCISCICLQNGISFCAEEGRGPLFALLLFLLLDAPSELADLFA